MPRWLAISTAVLGATVVAAAAAGWFLLRPRPVPALDIQWIAEVGVLAGDGVIGSNDGPSYTARFSEPFGIAATPDGGIVVADSGQLTAHPQDHGRR